MIMIMVMVLEVWSSGLTDFRPRVSRVITRGSGLTPQRPPKPKKLGVAVRTPGLAAKIQGTPCR